MSTIEALKNIVAHVHCGDIETHGTAFLVGPRHAITCAHVVMSRTTVSQRILLDFPRRFGGPLVATVVGAPDTEADIAILALAKDVVDAADILPFGETEPGDEWRAFGYPGDYDNDGILVSGKVEDPDARTLDSSVLQLSSDSAHDPLNGASGAPVVVERSGAIVGMLTQQSVAADTFGRPRPVYGFAFATPSRVLAEYQQRQGILIRSPVNQAPPLLVVYSGAHEDRTWLERFESRLKSLSLPYWVESDPSSKRFTEVLRTAQVVVPLVSQKLLHRSKIGLCERIAEAHLRTGVIVRPIRIESYTLQGRAPWGEARPINESALDEGGGNRYLTEAAERLWEIHRGSFCLKARDLLGARPTDVQGHVRAVVCLLGQADLYLRGLLYAVRDIAAFLLQEMLGCGSMAAAAAADPNLRRDVLEHLTRVMERWESDASGPNERDREVCCEIRTLIRCLRALEPLGASTTAEESEFCGQLRVPLSLLPLWVEAASQVALEDERWQNAARETNRRLPGYLAERYTLQDNDDRPLSLIRIFHSIWLCAVVLADHPPQEPDVRRHLAYVLREGLRFLCFGYQKNEDQRRPYYYFDTGRYAAALRTVITYHAGCYVGSLAPTIAEYLQRVVSTDGLTPYASAGHLQHILEIYMAGVFMLSVRIEGRPGEPTIAEALRGAERRDPKLFEQCLQAFILAALFHDVGHLFLPRIKQDIPELGLRSEPLRGDLKEFAGGLAQSSRVFARKCVDLLRDYGDDGPLAAWLDAQLQSPGHSLISAYYLARILEGREIDAWVRRSAIRAIMLHDALALKLSADDDPIAALLVLCDELFEWDPAQPITPGSPGKSLQVIAPEVPSHEPRDRWISVEHPQSMQGLEVWVTLAEPQDSSRWPRVRIHLQGPQRLAVPVHQLWLRKSANLGRIVRARSGFGPVVSMTSALPGGGETNRKRIETLMDDPGFQDMREVLVKWLETVVIETVDLNETIRLEPFGDQNELSAGLARVLKRLSAKAGAFRID